MLNPIFPALEINSLDVLVFSTSLTLSNMAEPLEILTCVMQKRDRSFLLCKENRRGYVALPVNPEMIQGCLLGFVAVTLVSRVC